MSSEKQGALSGNLPKLYGLCLIAFVNSATYGFDGSLMSGINAMPQYLSYFGLSDTGVLTGFIISIYQIGFIVSPFFAGPFADKYGRRAGMGFGSGIHRWCCPRCDQYDSRSVHVSVGTQASSISISLLLLFFALSVSRFILGCGICFASAAAPSWVAEISHPTYRGTITGVYNTFWYVGNILATWTLYPCSYLESEISFRLPVSFFGLIVVSSVWFMPESPRWLINNGKSEEALKILVHFHGDDDPDSELVKLEFEEMVEAASKTKESLYDYRPLFADRQNSYRSWLLIAAAVFGQMSGNAVISYFMPQMLKQAGITDTHMQLLLNAINSLISFAAAVTGDSLVDGVGRRNLLLVHGSRNPGSAVAVLFIYLFGIVFSFGWTPMQVLYPVEIVPYKNRAKGMGLNNLLVNICGFYSSYFTPIAMGSIGWRFYFVYIAWDLMEVFVIWKFFVETKGRTLEELDAIFDSADPVKESLKPVARDVVDYTAVDVKAKQ
ncbi:major facilitator superfamily domain-containing protein [Cladochytrium replicatum]|nr:major facilitator superfamily domain-containing protein [Cladochytrium replicatum]